MKSSFQVIIVGGGHAGCEAALAAAKRGASCLLLTQSVDQIGAMSCNPAIGGLAKGHLVKEIDALGGAMGQVADATAIQFRTLNQTKGAAVQATRCQSDMIAYKAAMRRRLEAQPGLVIHQGEVISLQTAQGRVQGLTTQLGEELSAPAVVIASGTFLNGLIHLGERRFPAGRAWDFNSHPLAEQLKTLGLRMGRLKTGTPPRLDGRTINFSSLEPQPGDPRTRPFSFWETSVPLPQVPCWITYTSSRTKEIIQQNLHKSAMYSGAITGIGPRYCPSVEDKMQRFADKERHQVFLEPTSLHSFEYYPNGMSTSLPLEVQVEFLRSIPGLEQVEIVRPGYAIEYDYCHPTQLKSSLEHKEIAGLFFAGQVNGTSGYEEAAAQGLLAGINAAALALYKEPLVLGRNQAYMGVLIDDLVSLGTEEPYRMFTSRAEYRLLLREDNADLRLTHLGREAGLINDDQWNRFQNRAAATRALTDYAETAYLKPTPATQALLGEQATALLPHRLKLADFLKRAQANLDLACQLPDQELDLSPYSPLVRFTVETEIKYGGYLDRQASQVKQYLATESLRFPEGFDFLAVVGLSNEVKQKLAQHRPQNLGQASRISGVTPASVVVLLAALKKRGTP